jgi:hypothetical protein
MALDLSNLQMIGGSRRGKAPALWTYATLDTHATVDSAGYFNAGTAYQGAYHLLEIGDIINVVVWATAIGTGGTLSTYGTHCVIDKASGVIDVTNVTVGTVTDSD